MISSGDRQVLATADGFIFRSGRTRTLLIRGLSAFGPKLDKQPIMLNESETLFHWEAAPEPVDETTKSLRSATGKACYMVSSSKPKYCKALL